MTIADEQALGNAVSDRLEELVEDMTKEIQVYRHSTDDISWSKYVTYMLKRARRDVMNLIADAGFDNRIKKS